MARPLTPEKTAEFDALLNFLNHFDKVGWMTPRKIGLGICTEVVAIETQYGKSKALSGLRQALADTLEMTSSRSAEWVKTFDQSCRTAGVKSLSEYRIMQWGKYKKLLERGKINNQEQFYMVSAILSDMTLPFDSIDREKLQEMVYGYERKII